MTTKVNVSANAITINKKSYNRRDIDEVEFKEPRNIFAAIFITGFNYLIAIVFVIGIPLAIIKIYYEVKYHRVVIKFHRVNKKGNKIEKIEYISKEDYDYLIANY